MNELRPSLFVYLAETVGYPAVKIGVTNDVGARMRAFATGCPLEVRVFAYFVGNEVDEGLLHRRFDHLRIRGEWFRPEGELRDFMAMLDAAPRLVSPFGAADVSDLNFPDGQPVTHTGIRLPRILAEGWLRLRDAAPLLAGANGGEMPSVNKVSRWATVGVRRPDGVRVCLETIPLLSQRVTSRPAVERFLATLGVAAEDPDEMFDGVELGDPIA